MKKNSTRGLLVVGVLALALVWFWRGGRQPKLNLQGTRVVAFGDSLTAPLAEPGEDAYPQVLARRLGVGVEVRGKRNDTAAQAFARLDEVLALKPDLVVMTMGFDDLQQKLPLQETYPWLEKMFAALRKAGVVVVFAGIAPPQAGDNWPMAMTQLCKSMDVVYVDDVLEGAWGQPEYWTSEGLPNAKGQALMAEKLHRVIARFWPKS